MHKKNANQRGLYDQYKKKKYPVNFDDECKSKGLIFGQIFYAIQVFNL